MITVTNNNRWMFNIAKFDKVEWAGEIVIITDIKDEKWGDKTPAMGVTEQGNECFPMIEECKLVGKFVGSGMNGFEISQETADLFTDWRKAELSKVGINA